MDGPLQELDKFRVEPGRQVELQSDQEAAGNPRKKRKDDEDVLVGPIQFTNIRGDSFLQRQQQHTKLLRGLYESELRDLISRFSDMFSQRAVPGEAQHHKLQQLLAADPKLLATAAAALKTVASTYSVEDIENMLDSAAGIGEQSVLSLVACCVRPPAQSVFQQGDTTASQVYHMSAPSHGCDRT